MRKRLHSCHQIGLGRTVTPQSGNGLFPELPFKPLRRKQGVEVRQAENVNQGVFRPAQQPLMTALLPVGEAPPPLGVTRGDVLVDGQPGSFELFMEGMTEEGDGLLLGGGGLFGRL